MPAPRNGGAFDAVDKRVERVAKFAGVGADHREALGKMRASCAGGVAHIGNNRVVRTTPQHSDEPVPSANPDREPTGPADAAGAPAEANASSRAGVAGGGARLEDHMGVAPAESERTDTGQPPTIDLRPWGRGDRNRDRQGRPVDTGVFRLQMQMRWYLLALQCQNDLADAGDARGGFKMSNVRLDRPDRQRLG